MMCGMMSDDDFFISRTSSRLKYCKIFRNHFFHHFATNRYISSNISLLPLVQKNISVVLHGSLEYGWEMLFFHLSGKGGLKINFDENLILKYRKECNFE